MRFSFVYIVTNKPQGVLYIGVTSDLVRRISEHRGSLIPGFSKRYLKRWYREWKVALIEENNPTWRDLFLEMSGLTA